MAHFSRGASLAYENDFFRRRGDLHGCDLQQRRIRHRANNYLSGRELQMRIELCANKAAERSHQSGTTGGRNRIHGLRRQRDTSTDHFYCAEQRRVLKPLATQTGVCSGGASGAPGTLDFTGGGGPLLRFVTFNTNADLRFIDGGTGTTGVT